MTSTLTPCTCTTTIKRDLRTLRSQTTRIPKPGCPIHTAKKATE